MLPPPMTMPTSTPSSMTSFTSDAICCSVFGEMPYLPSPIRASPLSLSRMRLKRGVAVAGVVTGGLPILRFFEGQGTSVRIVREVAGDDRQARSGLDARQRLHRHVDRRRLQVFEAA